MGNLTIDPSRSGGNSKESKNRYTLAKTPRQTPYTPTTTETTGEPLQRQQENHYRDNRCDPRTRATTPGLPKRTPDTTSSTSFNRVRSSR